MCVVDSGAFPLMMGKSSLSTGKQTHQKHQRPLGNPNRERYPPFFQRGEGFDSRARPLLLREVGGRFFLGIVVETTVRRVGLLLTMSMGKHRKRNFWTHPQRVC